MKTRYKILSIIPIFIVSWFTMGITLSSFGTTCVLIAEGEPSAIWLGSFNGCGPSLTYDLRLFEIPKVFAENEPTVAKLEWSQANYAVKNGTGAVKVIVTDPDMNVFPNNIDTLKAFVFSDSYMEGIILTLYETENDTGVFERTFTFSDNRSAPSVLYALEGDTVTVQYVDTTLPVDAEFESIKMTETMFLGLTGPPLERVPAELLRVEGLQGNVVGKIPTILVDQQVKIVADITNQMDRDQDFAYLVQILDEKKSAVSVSWLTGSLTPMQSFSSAQSWTPQTPGKYSATVFVWESINNPSALSPPLSIEIIVKEIENEN